jgi:hypothetical protein
VDEFIILQLQRLHKGGTDLDDRLLEYGEPDPVTGIRPIRWLTAEELISTNVDAPEWIAFLQENE